MWRHGSLCHTRRQASLVIGREVSWTKGLRRSVAVRRMLVLAVPMIFAKGILHGGVSDVPSWPPSRRRGKITLWTGRWGSAKLVRHPCIHLVLRSAAPIISAEKACHQHVLVAETTMSVLEPASTTVRSDPRHRKHVEVCLMYRGDVEPNDVNAAVATMTKKRTIQLVVLSPTRFPCLFSEASFSVSHRLSRNVLFITFHQTWLGLMGPPTDSLLCWCCRAPEEVGALFSQPNQGLTQSATTLSWDLSVHAGRGIRVLGSHSRFIHVWAPWRVWCHIGFRVNATVGGSGWTASVEPHRR